MDTHRLGNRNNSSFGRSLGLRLAYVVLLGLCALPGRSYAVTGRSLLVLSVTDGGRPQEPLRALVHDFLRRAGAKLVDLPRLSSAERNCQESSCLNSIAERHRTELILAARITRLSARDRDIYMWVSDSHSGGDQSERLVCDSIDLEERLREMAGRLVGPYLVGPEKEALAPADPVEPVPAEPVKPTEVVVPPDVKVVVPTPDPTPASIPVPIPAPAIVPPADEVGVRLHSGEMPMLALPRPAPWRLPLTSWRHRIALGLGILSVSALATAIPLHALTGMRTDNDGNGNSGDFVHSYTSLFIPMYAAAGALAVGTAVTLFWPAKKEGKK